MWLASGLALAPASLAWSQQPAPLSAHSRIKVEQLLHRQLPCLGCHALGDSGGRLAPDLATVRERRSPEYIAAIVSDPQGTVAGIAMPRTAMPPATRDLLIRYLQSLPGNATAGATSSPPAASAGPPDGSAIYGRWCASCHGRTGRGDGPNARFLPVKAAVHADAAAMSSRPDDSLYDTIAGGGAIMNRSTRMPAFGETLTDPEIRALVAYIRELCRCQGPAWSRDGARR